uniref:Uncharacterized protein n=1 Tax=Panagrolaimus sp. PS1159 TaxID=55785 RepID=A0AC35EXP0_9BILA
MSTSDVMTIASYAMPIAGFLGVGFGLASFALSHVSLPAQNLKKKFFDFANSGLGEDRMKLKKECKKAMPINIYDASLYF